MSYREVTFEKQRKLNKYYRKEYADGNTLFSHWDEFMWNYTHFRACLAILRDNPETKDDKDFNELCGTWEYGGIINYTAEDFDELERRYLSLKEKPAFQNNPFYDNLYGYFVKGPYLLFSGDIFYWKNFFKLD